MDELKTFTRYGKSISTEQLIVQALKNNPLGLTTKDIEQYVFGLTGIVRSMGSYSNAVNSLKSQNMVYSIYIDLKQQNSNKTLKHLLYDTYRK